MRLSPRQSVEDARDFSSLQARHSIERLMQLSETQMKITFEDEQERDNGDASV